MSMMSTPQQPQDMNKIFLQEVVQLNAARYESVYDGIELRYALNIE